MESSVELDRRSLGWLEGSRLRDCDGNRFRSLLLRLIEMRCEGRGFMAPQRCNLLATSIRQTRAAQGTLIPTSILESRMCSLPRS